MVLIIASHFVHAVVFERPWETDRLRGIVSGFTAAIVGSLPVAWLVLARVASGQTAGGTPEFTLKTVWVSFQGLLKLGVWTGSYQTFDLARELVALFILLAVGGLGLRSLYTAKSTLIEDRAVTVPVVVGAVSLGVIALVSLLLEPMWAGRRLAIVAPFLYLAVGIGAGRVKREKLAVTVVVGLVVVFTIGSFLFTAPVARPAWDDGVDYLDANADEDDLVVSGNPHPQPEVEYYREDGDYRHVGIRYDWTEESVSSKVLGPKMVWVIGYSERAEAARQGLSGADQYRQQDEIRFNGGLLLTRYERVKESLPSGGDNSSLSLSRIFYSRYPKPSD